MFRIAAWLIVTCAGLGCLGLLWIIKDISVSSGDIELWIPEESEERKILDEFFDRFGAEDMLMISWDGCQADDPVVGELADAIIDRDLKEAEEGKRDPYFISATCYQDLTENLQGRPGEKEEIEEEIRDDLRGFLIGKDGKTGLIMLEGNANCAANRGDAFSIVQEACEEVVGEKDFKFAGPMFVSICANKETTRTLVLVTPIVAVVSLLVALILLRDLFFAFLSFSVSGMASLMSLAAIHLCGKDLGDMIAVVPSIAQLLAMSNAVHFINYYKEEWLRYEDGGRAWRYSIRVGWLPTVAASLTTIIGFAALATSNLKVAGDFALFGGIGVLSAAVAVLLVIPSALIVRQPTVAPPHFYERAFIGSLEFLAKYLRWPTAILLTAVFVLGGMGLSKLKPDVRSEIFFSGKSEFRQHFDWFSDQFAPPTMTNLVVGLSNNDKEISKQEQFEFIDQLTTEIASLDDEYAVFSGSILTNGIPKSGLPLGMLERVYGQLWDRANEIGLVKPEENHDYWRISIRHPPDPDPRESEFSKSMDKILADESQTLSPPPRFVLTSPEQLFAKSQDGLLKQLLRTFLLAFIVITPIVVIFLRSFSLGAIAILGNLFPLAVFFGAMGWIGERIDIATMLIAAVAFGIAVDDTVHFLTWLGKGFEKKNSLREAVLFAFENSAGAILQTTLIISIGMMAFLLCDFRPSIRFATFSSAVLVIALIGDLIFLPALILCFSRKIKRQIETPEGQNSH